MVLILNKKKFIFKRLRRSTRNNSKWTTNIKELMIRCNFKFCLNNLSDAPTESVRQTPRKTVGGYLSEMLFDYTILFGDQDFSLKKMINKV